MAITTFDTHKFVRRLEQAGVPLEQAEVQAEVLTEAFNVNLESLVTKDYLAARFAEQNAAIDTRFVEQQAYIGTKFEQVNTRFAEQDAKINANFRILLWMVGIVQAFVILPYVERLLSI